ncbi:MAG: hypothetical protein ACTHLE_13790 [Agriterribacter sp.]
MLHRAGNKIVNTYLDNVAEMAYPLFFSFQRVTVTVGRNNSLKPFIEGIFALS